MCLYGHSRAVGASSKQVKVVIQLSVENMSNMSILFNSDISNITERNSSFDCGVLRVAYTGKNRNGSYISKDAYERSMDSIYNCPIVCRYDRESDTIGSHDVELVHDADGGMRLVNMTHPVGVVPEHANTWWEMVDDNGEEHEYLCVEVLLWKRQEAYRKIKEDGITDESMEISVKEGAMVDDVFHIERFEFTAFCLLGTAEPCFESASLEVFSHDEFKKQMAEMMKDFKESFSVVAPSESVDDKEMQYYTEGGSDKLNEIEAILEKYSVNAEDLDFEIDGMSAEELEAKLLEYVTTEPEKEPGATDKGNEQTGETGDDSGNDDDGSDEGDGDGADEGSDEDDDDQTGNSRRPNGYSLNSNFEEELRRAISVEMVELPWGGQDCRYWLVDYDTEKTEAYCYDMVDWLLYAFTYKMDGDNVVIDYESKKRMKYIITEFDEGSFADPPVQMYKLAVEKYTELAGQVDEMKAGLAELESLREFKQTVETEKANAEREAVFEQFHDLDGVEAFETLKENCADMDVEALEEKCYAIRGRVGTPAAKFSLEQKAPKLPVLDNVSMDNEPYGGAFREYGFTKPTK